MTDFEMIQKAKAGDEQTLNALMEKYKPVVNAIARKFFLVGASTDDLVQEGMIGLYKAYLGYKENSQAQFKTFANLCITRQIESAVKVNNRNKNLPLNTYFSINNQGKVIVQSKDDEDDNENGIYICSSILSPEESVILKERISEINALIENALSDFEKKVLSEYITGMNYVEIAKKLKKDAKSIDNALNRIKIKLKFLRI